MASQYQELPRYEDDDEKLRYIPEVPTYNEKLEDELGPDLEVAASMTTPTHNEDDLINHTAEAKRSSSKHASALKLVDRCLFERLYCLILTLKIFGIWLVAMAFVKLVVVLCLHDTNGMECVQIGPVPGFPAVGCVQWENRTESAWKVSDVAEDLLEVQRNISSRLSEHRGAVNEHMEMVDAAVKAITNSLDDESADLALIRSFLSKNEAGEMNCDIKCAELVAQYVQKQEFGLRSGGEAVKNLVAQLKAMDLEMAVYSTFLNQVEGKIAVLTTKLKPASLTWNPSVETASVENTVPPLNGPRSILDTSIFKTTEFVIRNSEVELRDLIVKSKLISISISTASSA